jgi:cytoskeletal protein RodZ
MRRSTVVSAALLLLAAQAWCRQDPPSGSSGQQQSSPQQSTSSSPAAQQDSLAEAARKAREQKKDAPKARKVFTNDNIPTEGGVSSVGDETAKPAGGTQAGSAAKAVSNDEKTWRERFAGLRHKLEQDQAELDVMQRELGVLNVQYYNDPMKTMQQELTREDVDKKTAAIEAKKKEIDADRQAISDAEDDLRKAGGDPGWANAP